MHFSRTVTKYFAGRLGGWGREAFLNESIFFFFLES